MERMFVKAFKRQIISLYPLETYVPWQLTAISIGYTHISLLDSEGLELDYIVFDMEFTVQNEKQYLSKIIEIGAIKLTDESGELEMVDLFHTYVRPGSVAPLSYRTMKFTGISQENVDTAPYFHDAVSASNARHKLVP